MEEFQVFKVPGASNASLKPSFLVMVLDGTGSMGGEYGLMLEAYKNVFSDEIKRNAVYAIQFGEQITSLDKFQSAGQGNFNHAFQNVLQKLKENLNADITICVVSDGCEPSNIEQLKEQIDAAKKRYQIQFTSIAVDKGYPYQLFQQFRAYFHNGAASCPAVQVVERAYRTGNAVCKENFIKSFKMVKSQLSQQSLIITKQNTYQYINSLPSNQAFAGSVVLSKDKKLETNDGQEIKETKNPAHIVELIQTSCQQFLANQQNNNFTKTAEQAESMLNVGENLLKKVDITESVYKDEVKKVLEIGKKDIQFLADIGKGNIKLDKLSDDEKTRLQESFNPKKEEIQKAQPEFVPSQAKEAFEQQLINLINEKSTQPDQMLMFSILSDHLEEAIENGKTQQEILQELQNTKKKSLQTLKQYTNSHLEWVKKFVDCYIKAI